jgi:hypothetical protein
LYFVCFGIAFFIDVVASSTRMYPALSLVGAAGVVLIVLRIITRIRAAKELGKKKKKKVSLF